MADYSPLYTPGSTWSSTPSATILGRQVLIASGAGTVAPSSATSAVVVGVAAFDATTTSGPVTVHTISGAVHELTASGSITAGNVVESAAAGAVAQGATNPIGVALTSAANGELVEVLGTR